MRKYIKLYCFLLISLFFLFDLKCHCFADPVSDSKNNDLDKKYELAISYINSDDKEKQSKGYLLLTEAADKGHADASTTLGICYINGNFFEQNIDKGKSYILNSAKKGDGWAQTVLGFYYFTGLFGEKNEEEAMKWLKKGAENRYPEAFFYLGKIFCDKLKIKEAITWYEKGADLNYDKCLLELGDIYQNKNLLKLNEIEFECKKSADYYNKIISIGNTDSVIAVAERYLNKSYCAYDPKKGFAILKQIENKNENTIVFSRIGLCYQKGLGVEVNQKQAYNYFLKSSEYNDYIGLYNLALYLFFGIGTEQNYKQSYDYFMKLLKDNKGSNVEHIAKIFIALMSEIGLGYEKNKDKVKSIYVSNEEFPYLFLVEHLTVADYFLNGDFPYKKNTEYALIILKNILNHYKEMTINDNKFLNTINDKYSITTKEMCDEKLDEVFSKLLDIYDSNKKYDEALEFAYKGIENKNIYSYFILEKYYRNGTGITKNLHEAKKILESLEDYLLKDGKHKKMLAHVQGKIGNYYLKGEGCRQDFLKAKDYFGKSCDNGDQDGCDAYKVVNQYLLNKR